MNVILYGRPEQLEQTEAALKSIDGIVPVYGAHPAGLAAELIFLDADNERVSWQYLVGQFGKICPQAKIVLLSGDREDAAKAFEAGVFDYLLKPVKKHQLARVIAKFKSRSRHEVPYESIKAGEKL